MGKQMTANGTKARAGVLNAGAPVHDVQTWDQSDWFRIEHEVRRLQVPPRKWYRIASSHSPTEPSSTTMSKRVRCALTLKWK